MQDNLNTHDGASLYEAFAPAEARRPLDKVGWHHTPKRGSRLSGAGAGASVMSGRRLGRRTGGQGKTAAEAAARGGKRGALGARVPWALTPAAARQELREPYPSKEDG